MGAGSAGAAGCAAWPALQRPVVEAAARMVGAQLFPLEHTLRRLGVSLEGLVSAASSMASPASEGSAAVGVQLQRTLLRMKGLSKASLLRAALRAAAQPAGQQAGGQCDAWRYEALWAELYGLHVPFTGTAGVGAEAADEEDADGRAAVSPDNPAPPRHRLTPPRHRLATHLLSRLHTCRPQPGRATPAE